MLSQYFSEKQKMRPVAFISRKLTPVDRNYDVGNRDLLAVNLALDEWRHWLEGAKHPFTVFTNHLCAAKKFNPREACWALFFTWFQFMMAYRPGSRNTKANALSCRYPNEDETRAEINITSAMLRFNGTSIRR